MTSSKSTSKKIYILLSASILAINSISGFSTSMASECTQKNSNGHCVKVQRDNQPKKDTHSKNHLLTTNLTEQIFQVRDHLLVPR